MSVSDLQKLGLLRPESKWDPKHTRSFVPRLSWMFLVLLSICGCIMIALGDGGVVTWVGLLVFSVSLVCFVCMNILSVNRALWHDGEGEDESGSP